MANPVHVLEVDRTAARRRSRPLAGLPLAPVVSLDTPGSRHTRKHQPSAQRLAESVTDIARHVLAIVAIIKETSHVYAPTPKKEAPKASTVEMSVSFVKSATVPASTTTPRRPSVLRKLDFSHLKPLSNEQMDQMQALLNPHYSNP